MYTYIVGDIHGCLDQLHSLLQQVNFEPDNDSLWATGDLIARGPKSLQTLQYLHDLGSSAKVVLGNHDLHLLAIYLGIKKNKPSNHTDAIFTDPNHPQLMEWLRRQPLLAEHTDFVICHAGISPQWDLEQARAAAAEVESILQSTQWETLMSQMHGDTPNLWSDQLTGINRYRYIINAFTRMRYCFSDGRFDMQSKKPPSACPPHASDPNRLQPWFTLPSRLKIEKTVIFGHWAALDGYQDSSVIGLDTGCVWGGKLSMLRWEDQHYFTQQGIMQK